MCFPCQGCSCVWMHPLAPCRRPTRSEAEYGTLAWAVVRTLRLAAPRVLVHAETKKLFLQVGARDLSIVRGCTLFLTMNGLVLPVVISQQQHMKSSEAKSHVLRACRCSFCWSVAMLHATSTLQSRWRCCACFGHGAVLPRLIDVYNNTALSIHTSMFVIMAINIHSCVLCVFFLVSHCFFVFPRVFLDSLVFSWTPSCFCMLFCVFRIFLRSPSPPTRMPKLQHPQLPACPTPLPTGTAPPTPELGRSVPRRASWSCSDWPRLSEWGGPTACLRGHGTRSSWTCSTRSARPTSSCRYWVGLVC